MNENDVPVKTSEGLAEIKTRALRLSPRMRTALLLVDGAKPVAELNQLITAAGGQADALAVLLGKGLISVPVQEAPAVEPAAESVAEEQAADPPQQASPPSQHDLPAEPPGEPAHMIPPAPPATANPEPDSAPRRMPETRSPTAASPDLPAARVAASLPQAAQFPEIAFPPREKPPAVPEQAGERGAYRSGAPASRGGQVVRDDAAVTLVKLTAAAPQVEEARRWDADAKLMRARAHLSSALDEHADIHGYLLRQKVMACTDTEQLHGLFDEVEKTLRAALKNQRSTEILAVAAQLLGR